MWAVGIYGYGPPADHQEWVTLRQAADLLGVPIRPVKSAAQRGLITASKNPFGVWIVKRESLYQWASRRQCPPGYAYLHQASKSMGISRRRILRIVRYLEPITVKANKRTYTQVSLKALEDVSRKWRLGRYGTRMPGATDEVLSFDQARRVIGLPARILREAIEAGELHATVTPAATWLVDSTSLLEWAMRRRDVRNTRWLAARKKREIHREREMERRQAPGPATEELSEADKEFARELFRTLEAMRTMVDRGGVDVRSAVGKVLRHMSSMRRRASMPSSGERTRGR